MILEAEVCVPLLIAKMVMRYLFLIHALEKTQKSDHMDVDIFIQYHFQNNVQFRLGQPWFGIKFILIEYQLCTKYCFRRID